MTIPASGQVSVAEIAALLAWARSLTQAGGSADPAERAAYQAAKTALLTRLTHQHPDNHTTTDDPQGTVRD
jgi:hypothetical protein